MEFIPADAEDVRSFAVQPRPDTAPVGRDDLRQPDDAEASTGQVLQRILRAIREHLDLDVAFVGEVVGDERVLRFVDANDGFDAIGVGDRDPLEESYCHYVLSGLVPELLEDPRVHPVTAGLAVTQNLPVGTHVSVPIRFSDGRTYGTFCCFATDVRQSVRREHLGAVRMMAELAGEYLEAIHAAERDERRRRKAVEEILADPDALTLHFQPLRDLHTMEIVAVEALSRFPVHRGRPDVVFAEAAAVGLGVELEMRAVRLALRALPHVPDPIRLNVNVSPDTLLSPDFMEAIEGVPRDRLVAEVTEHAAIGDYGPLQTASARLTERGVGLAIDDVGMGFSGLNRILQSSPEELKLDGVVIRDVHTSPVKQALVESFCAFGRRAGFDIVAEGIESAAELDALRVLGANVGQGYHLGRPQPLRRLFAGGPPSAQPHAVDGIRQL